MTHPNPDTPGIALVCDSEGVIEQVIRDELGITDEVAPGQVVNLIFDRASLSKSLHFLAELRGQGAAFGWELNIPIDGKATTLHFGGGSVADKVLIVGAKTGDDVMKLYEELMRINNEQVNAIRKETKSRIELTLDTELDSILYDDLSQLNNELVNLQRELAKKNVELERLNEQKNQFLGMAAHDLRSPLSVILAYSEFMIDEAAEALDPEHVEFLHIIRESSRFILQLVNDLLDISTIESGQLNLKLELELLPILVNRNATLNRILAQQKQIELICHCDQNLPPTLVDRAKIEQVLNNLISNAIKFSYPHSTIEIGLTQQENDAIIWVKDEGKGIPAHELDSLFNLFGKTTVTGTAGERSTGLGLAIAHKIITGHGGRIWVESEAGKGTTVFVSLPLQLPAER